MSPHFQELLSLAKRKRVDSGEQEEPVSKPAASTDSETSDSDDEVCESLGVYSKRLHLVSLGHNKTFKMMFKHARVLFWIMGTLMSTRNTLNH